MTTQNKSQSKPDFPQRKKSPLLPTSALIGGIAVAVWAGWRGMTAPVVGQENSGQNQSVEFVVQPGVSGNEVGQQLAQAGLIKSLNGWKVWTKLKQISGDSGGFKAGTYLVSPKESLPEIASKIWAGAILQTNFTIPEGWSTMQMGRYFESQGYFTAEEFAAAVETIPSDKYLWLPDNIPILEGFLYPDTYQLSSDATSDAQAIIDIMLTRFEQVALPVYEAAQTDMSLLDWVTLGSIVEKESVVAEERALIAGVFTARLNQGMRLESDPTVEYGLGIRQTADQPLTYAQVGTPSPYNTYLNAGLPPTPIAAPGIASLKATLNPESTDYLFFVARYDGTHVFSKTFSEHEAAVQEIRRQRNQ